jgi:protein-S-isoprenylcysteine O-methyltransferase Ste14
MKKLNALGIGPKIAMTAIPWLALTVFLSIRFEGKFAYTESGSNLLLYAGVILVSGGLLMYFFTAPFLLKGVKETKLVTKGFFYLCCNPLYVSIILFIIPGTSLLMNSWIVITASIVAYIVFRIFIKSEYLEMEQVFGDEYRKYRQSTPEFIPLPIKKIFSM